jgi:prepilin-type N-terminal cleavage/methylation domain-containing protein
VHRTLAAQAGFTLLEVLVALAVMSLAIVTLFQLTSHSLRLVKTSGDYQEAVLLADRIATETQPSEETTDSGEEGPFQWERRVAVVPMPEEFQPKVTIPGREPAQIFAVTIDVRWGQNQVLELATLRTPTSAPPIAAGIQTPPGSGVQPSIIPTPRQPGNPRTGGS